MSTASTLAVTLIASAMVTLPGSDFTADMPSVWARVVPAAIDSNDGGDDAQLAHADFLSSELAAGLKALRPSPACRWGDTESSNADGVLAPRLQRGAKSTRCGLPCTGRHLPRAPGTTPKHLGDHCVELLAHLRGAGTARASSVGHPGVEFRTRCDGVSRCRCHRDKARRRSSPLQRAADRASTPPAPSA